jgi:hypothetical protein
MIELKICGVVGTEAPENNKPDGTAYLSQRELRTPCLLCGEY